jgi:hypothetical protein
MSAAQMRIAQLDAAQLAKLQKLEQELGSVIVALEPAARPAALSDAQVQRLQEVEQELGVVLLAYQPHP